MFRIGVSEHGKMVTYCCDREPLSCPIKTLKTTKPLFDTTIISIGVEGA